MTLQDDSHGSTPVAGERRRRREAERAAREAAEHAAQATPPTRRELRQRALEAEASRNAQAADDAAPPADAGPRSVDATERPTVPGAERPSGNGTARRASGDGSDRPGAGARTAERPVEAGAERPVPGPRTAEHPADAATEGPRMPRTPEGGPAQDPAAAAPSARPARRSVRDLSRTTDGAKEADHAPTERTGTMRRPVVRAPHEARGVRSLDATGTLTGIQPVTPARPKTARPEPEAEPVSTDPAAWESATALPAVSAARGATYEISAPAPRTTPAPAESGAAETAARPVRAPRPGTVAEAPGARPDTVRPAPASRPIPAPRRPVEPSTPVAHADVESAPSPQWAPLSSFSAPSSASGDEAGGTRAPQGGPAPRRPLRERLAEQAASTGSAESPDDDEDDDYPPNPVATVVKMVILVIAAVIIGVLIGLLAFGGDETQAMAAGRVAATLSGPSSA